MNEGLPNYGTLYLRRTGIKASTRDGKDCVKGMLVLPFGFEDRSTVKITFSRDEYVITDASIGDVETYASTSNVIEACAKIDPVLMHHVRLTGPG